MFTGIVQAVGKVREPEKLGNGVRLTILAPDLGLNEVKVGDSIAVNGACMTVIEVGEREFKIDVSAESLSKTTGLDTFGEVNLEKAMRLSDRIDGHIVSGHVDGVNGACGGVLAFGGACAARAFSLCRLQRLHHHQRCIPHDQQGRGYGARYTCYH